MPTRAPDETDVLCENCGYTLNGLPDGGKCPECGSSTDLSTSELVRKPPLWEDIGDSRSTWRRFLVTTAQVIFRPTRFYRYTTSRGNVSQSGNFANIHSIIAALLVSYAFMNHYYWFWHVVMFNRATPIWLQLGLMVGFPVGFYAVLRLTIRLAAKLTTLEATYRGYRLPVDVVRRRLNYHAAHFLPVAILAAITCGGYEMFTRSQDPSAVIGGSNAYLYTLCGEVIVSAGYLFNTYSIAMRNLMYANR